MSVIVYVKTELGTVSTHHEENLTLRDRDRLGPCLGAKRIPHPQAWAWATHNPSTRALQQRHWPKLVTECCKSLRHGLMTFKESLIWM